MYLIDDLSRDRVLAREHFFGRGEIFYGAAFSPQEKFGDPQAKIEANSVLDGGSIGQRLQLIF